jgi:hypothetical protein
MAHVLLYVGSWAISHSEIPGFAPPPRDELALFDALGIGSHRLTLEGSRRPWRIRTGLSPKLVLSPKHAAVQGAATRFRR